jgi:hypothetical protein
MAEFNSCAKLIEGENLSKVLDMLNQSPDLLQDMLNMQNNLQTTLAQKLPKYNIAPSDIQTKGELVSWVDSNFDAIMDEFRELKNAIGGMSNGEKSASAVWKKWKSNHGSMQSEKLDDMSQEDKLELMFECIDIWHFVMNLFLGLKLDSKDIYTLYMLKNFENLNRYNNGY